MNSNPTIHIKQSIRSYLLIIIGWGVVFFCTAAKSNAQSINRFKITVGKDAPAFLQFNDDIGSFEFTTTEGYKFFDAIRRNQNALSIAYKREAGAVPGTQVLVVMEGKRTHTFLVLFDKDYDINKNVQLSYDYSDLKELKKMIAAAKTNASETADKSAPDEALRAKAAQEQQEAKLAKQNQEAAAARKKQEAADAAKAEAQKKKDQEAAITKAKADQKRLTEEKKKAEKEEAAEKERMAKQEKADAQKAEQQRLQEQKEEQQRLAEAKKAAEQRKKEQEQLAAKQAQEEAARQEELRRIADAKERAAKERLAQQKADEAKRLQEQARMKEEARLQQEQQAEAERERLAKQKATEAERKRVAEQQKREADAERKRLALEMKKQEEEAAKERLRLLEEEKKKLAEERKYSTVGLWERYGSKGINLYDIPEQQHELNNGDFYLTNDTLRNFQVSEKILADNATPLLRLQSKPIKSITLTVENIHFVGGNVYYTILIDNQSNDDFLQGPIGLYWYNKDGAPYRWLNCSYYTYIDGFNLVKPGTRRKIVFVTRLADVPADESLLLVMQDRRPGSEKMSVLIEGSIYVRELKKTETNSSPSKSEKSSDGKRKKKNRD